MEKRYKKEINSRNEKSFFEFKQFKVFHDKTAMKVGTDGVLLGAVSCFRKSKKILDIGSGTGLISLMAAQKSKAQITAIEIDKEAFNQSVENFERSLWNDRLTTLNISFQNFWIISKTKFDYIVCNPPFFENSYKATGKSRNIARHNEGLPFDEIFKGVKNILSAKGKFSIIIPFKILNKIINIADNNLLFPERIVNIKPNINKETKRSIIVFSKIKSVVNTEILIIETNKRHQYTDEYIKLTKEFYLKM